MIEMIAPDMLMSHPWVQAFDRLAPPQAWIVGGVVLRSLVPGDREPRDLDVQFEGSVEGALELETALREQGIPANVRSLQAPIVPTS